MKAYDNNVCACFLKLRRCNGDFCRLYQGKNHQTVGGRETRACEGPNHAHHRSVVNYTPLMIWVQKHDKGPREPKHRHHDIEAHAQVFSLQTVINVSYDVISGVQANQKVYRRVKVNM